MILWLVEDLAGEPEPIARDEEDPERAARPMRPARGGEDGEAGAGDPGGEMFVCTSIGGGADLFAPLLSALIVGFLSSPEGPGVGEAETKVMVGRSEASSGFSSFKSVDVFASFRSNRTTKFRAEPSHMVELDK
jgi:hypothetical protein